MYANKPPVTTTADIPNKVFRHIARKTFTNRHGVTFEAEDLYTLSATKVIGKMDNLAQLNLEFWAKTRIFAQTFEIATVRDLYSINSSHLDDLYTREKAELVCHVQLNNPYCLVFKLDDGKTIAKDDWRVKHRVTQNLRTPEDYMTYTVNYFNLFESSYFESQNETPK